MAKRDNQASAAGKVREFLLERGYDIASRSITLEGNQVWIVFEQGERKVAIDGSSGLWVKASGRHAWRCIEGSCTLGGALQAVEFLTEEMR